MTSDKMQELIKSELDADILAATDETDEEDCVMALLLQGTRNAADQCPHPRSRSGETGMTTPVDTSGMVEFALNAVDHAAMRCSVVLTGKERISMALDFMANWITRANAKSAPTINIKWDIPTK